MMNKTFARVRFTCDDCVIETRSADTDNDLRRVSLTVIIATGHDQINQIVIISVKRYKRVGRIDRRTRVADRRIAVRPAV